MRIRTHDPRGLVRRLARTSDDDAHLYIGMKCLMPKGAKPAGQELAFNFLEVQPFLED